MIKQSFADWQLSHGIVPWTIKHGIAHLTEVMALVAARIRLIASIFARALSPAAERATAAFKRFTDIYSYLELEDDE